MSVVSDIAAAYKGPRRSMRRQIAQGVTEEQTLFYAILFGAANLLAQVPQMYAHTLLTQKSFAGQFGAQFIASIFFLPLVLYGLSALVHLLVKLFGGKGDWGHARRAFIWPALVASPLVLVNGIAAVVVDDFVVKLALAGITALVFVWQLCACVSEAEFPTLADG